MRNIVLIAATLFLFPFAAQAQTPVTQQQADSYYQTCVTNAAASETRFSPQSQKMFCACTAAHLMQSFSVEDMQTMTSPTDPNARIALNKMIVNVYAPCMEMPTQDYHYQQCMQNPQTAMLSKNPDGLCSCAAKAVAGYMQSNSAQMFQDILSRNPNIEDPMQALYDDPEFQKFAQTQLMNCVGR